MVRNALPALVCALVALAWMAHVLRDPHVLMRRPFRVAWRESMEGAPYIKLMVELGNRMAVVDTMVMAGTTPASSARALRRVLAEEFVGLSNGYLFIRENSGGSAVRASVDHVFTGSRRRLREVGTVSAALAEWAGGQLHGMYFHDLYNRLEFNDLTCKAGSPIFTVLLRERDGELFPDTDATWRYNRDGFWAAYSNLVSAVSAQKEKGRASPIFEPTEHALLCLSIARYCRKDREFALVMEQAPRVFRDVNVLLDEVNSIEPGERPLTIEEQML